MVPRTKSPQGYRIGISRRDVSIPDHLVAYARHLYEEQNVRPQAIAEQIGVAVRTLYDWLYYRRRTHVMRFEMLPEHERQMCNTRN